MTPALVSSTSLIAPNVTMIWIGKEWNDPQVVKNLLPGMTRALKANYGDRADSNLQKIALLLMKDSDLTERQWIYVQRMYEDVLRDRNTAGLPEEGHHSKIPPEALMDRMARISAVYPAKGTRHGKPLYARSFLPNSPWTNIHWMTTSIRKRVICLFPATCSWKCACRHLTSTSGMNCSGF